MEHLVVGVDGSPQADRALRWAAAEARLRSASVDLVLCYLSHNHRSRMVVADRDTAQQRLDEIVERNRDLLDDVKWTASTLGVPGSASTGLVRESQHADLVVTGARGAGGFDRLRLGTTGHRTAAYAASPVAVIPRHDRQDRDGKRPIVVGVDDSRAARRALRWALDEAGRRQVAITIVHTYAIGTDTALLGTVALDVRKHTMDAVRDRANDFITSLLERSDLPDGVEIERVVAPGPPTGALLEASEPEHLLVVGTRGNGPLGRLVFGSVSQQCLQHAVGPVVVVP